MMKLLVFLLAWSAIPLTSAAHVAFTPDSAVAGGKYIGALRVSHGCKGSATTRLRVEIPQAVKSAKPQAKPGWEIAMDRTGDRVSAVTWAGRLPDDQFDDFTLMLSLPADAGALYFPAVQTCESGREEWRTIPVAGQAWHDADHPAPVLNITVAPAATEAHHH